MRGVALAEGSDTRFFLREFRAALPAAALRMRPGWLAVKEWVPGDDQAGGGRLGLGRAAADRRSAGPRGEHQTAEEGVGRERLREGEREKGSVSGKIPSLQLLSPLPVFFPPGGLTGFASRA